jgi:hypothetical protein
MDTENKTVRPEVDAILQSMAKMRADARCRLKANRDRILKALKAIGVTRVVVSYSGSGDSGQIDHVDIYQGDQKVEAKRQISILRLESRWNAQRSTWDEKLKNKRVSLSEALEELVYDWLEAEHGGWENNDGASGECTIDVSEDQFVLGHTNYYTESDYTESAL